MGGKCTRAPSSRVSSAPPSARRIAARGSDSAFRHLPAFHSRASSSQPTWKAGRPPSASTLRSTAGAPEGRETLPLLHAALLEAQPPVATVELHGLPGHVLGHEGRGRGVHPPRKAPQHPHHLTEAPGLGLQVGDHRRVVGTVQLEDLDQAVQGGDPTVQVVAKAPVEVVQHVQPPGARKENGVVAGLRGPISGLLHRSLQ